MSERPYLTQQEIDEITEPLTRAADQCRWLREAGFVVKTKPSGRPLVARSNFECVMSGASPKKNPVSSIGTDEPDAAALAAVIGKKGVTYGHGKKAQRQPAGPA